MTKTWKTLEDAERADEVRFGFNYEGEGNDAPSEPDWEEIYMSRFDPEAEMDRAENRYERFVYGD